MINLAGSGSIQNAQAQKNYVRCVLHSTECLEIEIFVDTVNLNLVINERLVLISNVGTFDLRINARSLN